MDKRGMIFDIKEFSTNDGPGIRTTVFMKGCPLRCCWCHNPEGLSPLPQRNLKTQQLVGREWRAPELIKRLSKYMDFWNRFGGGLTFSGGEPSLQAQFITECLEQLPGVHALLDTCGYCEEECFISLAKHFQMLYFDLKLADDKKHSFYTGVSNQVIIRNLCRLIEIKDGPAITLRLPMIPNITDTESSLNEMQKLITDLCPPDRIRVDILPYNIAAGGKYPIYGMQYPLNGGYTINHTNEIARFAQALKEAGYQLQNEAI